MAERFLPSTLAGWLPDMEAVIDYVHPNGVSLKLPATMSAHQLPDGFLVALTATLQTRAPEQVSVALRQGASMPEGEWPGKKRVAGREFAYRIDREDGGSGGEIHILNAWCRHAEGHVLVTQVSQAEWPAVPDHSLAWDVIATIGGPQVAEGR